MTGKIIGAQEAFQLGIVNRVFPQASLMEETKKVAFQIAANGVIARKTGQDGDQCGF